MRLADRCVCNVLYLKRRFFFCFFPFLCRHATLRNGCLRDDTKVWRCHSLVMSVPRNSNHRITFYRVIPTGTTWLQEIVWQVYHNGEISKEGVESRYPQLEKSQLFQRPGDESQAALNSRPSPRLIKSHLPYHLIPMSENEANRSKYLYIARNPKDAAISFYHFVSSFGPASHFSGTWEFFAKLLIEGKGINSVKYLLEYADID